MSGKLHDTPMSLDLIFDFGLHQGEDTDFYLRKGFRVVAFEANPQLAEACRQRFASAIAERQLVIVEGAIVAGDRPRDASRSVTFYVNKDRSIWGTTNKGWAERNASLGHLSDLIAVPAVDLERVFVENGIPYYMKIDIEGCDMVCLRALENFRYHPSYVSLESNKTSLAGIGEELEVLTALGYGRFKVIEQSSISLVQHPPKPPREGNYVEHQFEHGSSGLFGAELPGHWRSRRPTMRKYALIRLGYYLLGDAGIMRDWRFLGAGPLRFLVRQGLQLLTRNPVPGWYDTHASHCNKQAL